MEFRNSWSSRRLYADTDHSQSRNIKIKTIKKLAWRIDEPVFVEGKFNVKKENIPK